VRDAERCREDDHQMIMSCPLASKLKRQMMPVFSEHSSNSDMQWANHDSSVLYYNPCSCNGMGSQSIMHHERKDNELMALDDSERVDVLIQMSFLCRWHGPASKPF